MCLFSYYMQEAKFVGMSAETKNNDNINSAG